MAGALDAGRGQIRWKSTSFQAVADREGVELEISPKLIEIFTDGIERYGEREWSPNIIRRLEDACDVEVLAPGFPAQMLDDEPEELGYEIDSLGRCSGSG